MKNALLRTLTFLCSSVAISQPFLEYQDLSVTGVIQGEMYWIDANNDNYLEIIYCGDENNSNTLVTKLITNTNLDLEAATSSLVSYSEPALDTADFNNDGYTDFVITGSASGSQPITIYTSNGNGTFTANTPSIAGRLSGDIKARDFNGDGLVDIMVTGQSTPSYNSTTTLYLQDTSSNFTESTVNIEGINNGTIAPIDVNNDGHLDVIVSGFNTSYATVTKLYQNDGTGSFTEILNHNISGMYYSAITVADYDNDGDQDVAISGKENFSSIKTEVLTNNGSGIFTVDTNIVLTASYNGTIDFADTDNDGDLDIFITGEDASNVQHTYLYENNGGTYVQNMGVSDSIYALSSSLSSLADYDNDGDLDIAVSGWDNNYDYFFKVYINGASEPAGDLCLSPDSLNTSSVTTTSAVLEWVAGGNENTWDVEWGTQGFTQGSGNLISATSTNPYALTSLDPSTAYEFYVKSNCSSDSSSWQGPFVFTTLAEPCINPESLGVDNLASFSTTLTWAAGGNENTWDVEWGLQGFTQGAGTMVQTINTNAYELTNLIHSTTYEFYVKSNCSTNESNWVGPYSFTTTTNVGLNEYNIQNTFVYPNPNHGAFYIHNAFNKEKTFGLTMINVDGKTIYEQTLQISSLGHHKIEVEHLSKGMYFVLLKSDGGIERHRLVVK